MQYPFTDEQKALAELTKDFMEREVLPVAAEMDRYPDPKDCYPAELINKASKIGLRTFQVLCTPMRIRSLVICKRRRI